MTLQMTPSHKKTDRSPLTGSELVEFIRTRLDDGKAENIMIIDLKKYAGFTDYLIIASGTSSRHVTALARNLSLTLKENRLPARIEGDHGKGSWVVLDAKDVVVHLFDPETRARYALEEIWKNA